jgi:type IV secretion system protein TrbF
MVNPFRKEMPPYKAAAPETPYQRAQQEWDERIGSARVQAENWRFIAFAAAGVALLALVTLIMVLSFRSEKVFVAEVTTGGRIVNIVPLRTAYNPTTAQKEYFIGQFIELLRTVPLDPVMAKKNWVHAYSFLSQRAASKLNALLQKNNPLEMLGKKTVAVKINNINSMSDNSCVVEWTESVVNVDGQGAVERLYSGVFTTMTRTPSTQNEIMQNPLGIYIVDFSISEKGK